MLSPTSIGEEILIPIEDREFTIASLSDDGKESVISPNSIGEVGLAPVEGQGVSITSFSREIPAVNETWDPGDLLVFFSGLAGDDSSSRAAAGYNPSLRASQTPHIRTDPRLERVHEPHVHMSWSTPLSIPSLTPDKLLTNVSPGVWRPSAGLGGSVRGTEEGVAFLTATLPTCSGRDRGRGNSDT